MAGGEAEDFERARPLFEVMGETIVHVGESGAGQVTKAANQIVVALVIEAVSEALVLGLRGGVDPRKSVDVLSGGLAANTVMEVKGEKFLTLDFEPGGKVEFHHKDLGIALRCGQGIRCHAADYGPGGPDVRVAGGDGQGSMGPLGPDHPARRRFNIASRL